MISGLASKTFCPTWSATSAVKRPESSTGQTRTMPFGLADALVVLAEARVPCGPRPCRRRR